MSEILPEEEFVRETLNKCVSTLGRKMTSAHVILIIAEYTKHRWATAFTPTDKE